MFYYTPIADDRTWVQKHQPTKCEGFTGKSQSVPTFKVSLR